MELRLMEIGRHLDEHEVERYSMRQMGEGESAAFEEHLLICEVCQQRVQESDDYVTAMGRAAAQLRATPEPVRRPAVSWVPAWALAVSVIAIAVVLVGTKDLWHKAARSRWRCKPCGGCPSRPRRGCHWR